MQHEIEAKFLEVDFDELRDKLKDLGADCVQPMRLMRRVLFDLPDGSFRKHNQDKRLRVRDEGDKVTINFKSENETKYVSEIEVAVNSFDDTCKLFKAMGLVPYSFQESKRETWEYKNTEIVLDEWPWLDTYIEVEGPDEESIKSVAGELGFNWDEAYFGSVDTVYRYQYPLMKETESISDVGDAYFNQPLPDFLKRRMAG